MDLQEMLNQLLSRLAAAPPEEACEIAKQLGDVLARIDPNIEGGKQLSQVLSSIQNPNKALSVRDRVELQNPSLMHFFFQSRHPALYEPIPRTVEELEEALAKAPDTPTQQRMRDAAEFHDEGNGILQQFLYRRTGGNLQEEIEPYN